MINEIDPKEAKTRLDKGALLVDVREIEEVEEFACDVPESIIMPLSEFKHRYQELPKDRELILACAGGGRSLHACMFLAQQGYANIANLYGGVFTWNSMGLPVKKEVVGAEKSVNACRLW